MCSVVANEYLSKCSVMFRSVARVLTPLAYFLCSANASREPTTDTGVSTEVQSGPTKDSVSSKAFSDLSSNLVSVMECTL